MSIVVVFLTFDGRTNPEQWRIPEKVIEDHSETMHAMLQSVQPNPDGSPKRITVHGSHGPFKMVLDQLEAHGSRRNFEIKWLSNLPIEHAAMLWEATEMLQIKPQQDNLYRHIRWWISHQMANPTQLVALHKIFYRFRDELRGVDNKSTWYALVHHTAFNIVNNVYTIDEINFLHPFLHAQVPDFAAAVSSKVQDLDRSRDLHNLLESRRLDKEGRKESQQRAKAHKAEQRTHKQTELRGERQLSEGMARQVISQAPAMGEMVVQQGRHGKRNPAGEGKRAKKAKGGKDEGGWSTV